jgi:glycosyltransferase involved in cell wall biosynthesis
MIEAMATGLPPVVSSVGNIPSVIEDGKNGLLIEPKNPDSISSALNRIMDNKLLIEKLGKNAHEYARDNFSTEVAVKKLSNVIHEVLSV